MIRGSCLCGVVQYEIAGPVSKASHCYCTMCQKQHGAAAGSYVNVASADFRYTAGADSVRLYRSSPHVQRGFCAHCGSSLSWQSDAHADRIAITPGTFDTPWDGQVDILLHMESKPGWMGSLNKE